MNNGFSDLNGARCRVFGLGRSNEALISYLDNRGAEIAVSDKRKSESEIIDVLSKKNIKNAEVIPYGDSGSYDIVFRTPSIRPDAPEIISALEKGAMLSSETELFFSNAKGTLIGITGSDGKTTTTTVTYEILKKALGEERIFLGGNIGVPLISFIDKLTDESVTVCELSSFQLMTFTKAPQRSAITNITENHLDYHKDMEEYIRSKMRIFGNDTELAVLSEQALPYFSDFKGCKKTVTSFTPSEDGASVIDGAICYNGRRILDIGDIKVSGRHNISNFMTAISLTYDLADKGVFTEVAHSFSGVPHRNELVRVVGGVRYFNCSIDSTPSRTIATLSAHQGEDITLICGGYDKNLDFTEFSRIAPSFVKRFILFGQTSEKISASLKGRSDSVHICRDIYEATDLARALTAPASSVLLSPASASFDMFKDFEERGNIFKNIINNL